jgi:hypothetical protein
MFSQRFGTTGYDAFYAGLQHQGHFELVDDPASADLVFEFGIRAANADNAQRFELTIVDAKTHFPLWSLVEGFDYVGSRQAAEKSFSRHIDHLVALIGKLATSSTQMVGP